MSMPKVSGTFTQTISFNILVHPIVKRLTEDRQLSKLLSEFLWDRFGDDEEDKQIAQINNLRREADRLIKMADKQEVRMKERQPLIEKKSALEEINDQIMYLKNINGIMKQVKERGHVLVHQFSKAQIDQADEYMSKFGGHEFYFAEMEQLIEARKNLNIELTKGETQTLL